MAKSGPLQSLSDRELELPVRPLTIYPRPGSVLAAAGLTWSMDVAGEHVRCMVVITREARDASGDAHDRMPAFLTLEAMDAWLEPVKLDKTGRDELLTTLDGPSADVAATIREHVVDRKVNNSRAVDPADPTVIAPAG